MGGYAFAVRASVHVPACPVVLALLAALLAACAGQGKASVAPATVAPTSTAAGALPASLATSPVVATRSWTWESTNGIEVETRHWSIKSSLRSANFLGSLPGFYEAALANYRTGLVPLPEPPQRMEACLFGTREEWARYTQHRLGDDAATYLKMGRGGFTTAGEAVLYDIGPRDTLAIAAHEGWHQYSQTTFRSALPVWLEEGIACYMEGFRMPPGAPVPTFLPWRNAERYSELRSAFRKGRLPALREFLEGSPQSFLAVSRDAQLAYYAQAWALVHFLREGEGGRWRPRLEAALQQAVRGELPAAARTGPGFLVIAIEPDFDAFARAYDRFVGALVDANSWDRVIRGESPLEPATSAPDTTSLPRNRP